MEVMLYHGSDKIIEQPIYGKGNANNDYGKCRLYFTPIEGVTL